MAASWEFAYLPSAVLPPLAWIARVEGSTECPLRTLRAHTEGREPPAGHRPRIRRRLALRSAARTLRLKRLTGLLAKRRRAMIHSEPALGSLLFRWAVSVVRTRYSGG